MTMLLQPHPLVGAEQGTDAWHMERLGHATGSRFDDVLAKLKDGKPGAGRGNYCAELVVERLTGKWAPSWSGNDHTERGNALEPSARELYELRRGVLVDKAAFMRHATIPWLGVSLDGLIGDDGALEIKSPLPKIHFEYMESGVMAPKYKAQVQGGLWVSGRKWCDWCSYNQDMPERMKLLIVRVTRDDEYIKNVLMPEVTKFLNEVRRRLDMALERFPEEESLH